ncbi:MAG TPA: lysyl oxidase family protein [Kofleriaceae bacterium]|nr:lysyl oxidase family protein [Kofleriaceae bacterium]
MVALAVSGACGDNLSGVEDGEGGGRADAGQQQPAEPILSHEPAWIARGQDGEECFGSSSAIADLDGDGRSDLVVGIPRCQTAPADKVAVFRGAESALLEDEGTRAQLDWENENPVPFNVALRIATGDVDGDRRADVLLSTRDGAALYRGDQDLAAMFAQPHFRLPGENFGPALLADLDGDGRDDIAARIGGETTVFLTTDGDQGPVFTQTRTLTATPGGAGDVDADGKDDLFVEAPDGTVQLYLGCDGELPACDGGLGSEPAWSVVGSLQGAGMDIDGDGRADAVLGDFGRIAVHLTSQADDLLPDSPGWEEQGDANFLGFGRSIAAPVGLLGSGRQLLVGATARVYLYRVPEGPFDDLAPVWAFPEPDRLTADWPIDLNFAVVAAGDLDADGYQDFVVSGSSLTGGVAMVFTGGALPDDAPAPSIPEALACGPLTGGTADLTVDADVMARSLLITTEPFAEDSCEVREACVNAPGDRKLLRFSVSIENLGAGDAIVPGPEEAPDLYQFDECHGHDHLIGFSSYRLVGADGTEVMGHKQGYFMVDVAPYCAESGPPVDHFPSQGVSAGWSDVYIADYPCQWIDITGVPDGTYELHVSVDDADVVPEADQLPNEVAISVRIAGDQVTVPRR